MNYKDARAVGAWVRTVPGILTTFYVQILGVTFLSFSHQLRDPHASQPKEVSKSVPKVPGAQPMSVRLGTCHWEQAIDLLPGFPHPWYQ